MTKSFIWFFIMLTLFCGCDAFQEPVKLVFIAGPNDHCRDKPCHLYIEDLTLLKDMLETTEYGPGFEVELYIGERPKPGTMDDVDAVVIHSSGDRLLKEWHSLFPQNEDKNGYNPEYLKFLHDFDRQMERGMGLMVLHYSTWVDHPMAQERYFDWIGGYYQRGQSHVDGDGATPGTTAMEAIKLASNHPVLNGVEEWESPAEFYYDMKLDTKNPNFTPLLASDLPLDNPQTHTVAWAVEREGGGRGIGFTGAHFHQNMFLESFRKTILNGILWISKVEVPVNGFESVVEKKYWNDENTATN